MQTCTVYPAVPNLGANSGFTSGNGHGVTSTYSPSYMLAVGVLPAETCDLCEVHCLSLNLSQSLKPTGVQMYLRAVKPACAVAMS